MARNTKIGTTLAALTVMFSATFVAAPRASAGDISVVGTVCQYASGTPFAIPCFLYQNYTTIRSLWISLSRLWTCSTTPTQYRWATQLHRWPSGVVTANPMTLVGLMYDSGQTNRMSVNIDKSIFNTSAGGRYVYVLYADVRPEDRAVVKFGLRADRPWRADENRSTLFGHGQWKWVSRPGSNDCGYYIGNTTGMGRQLFMSRNPVAKILLIAD